MKELFRTKFGSHFYGTDTPQSDTDWKVIYLPDLNDMLVGKQLKNKVKKTNSVKNTRNGADDVDEEFIPVQVFAQHFLEGQTYALELAYNFDSQHASQTFSPEFALFCFRLRKKFLTKNIKAMMGYAVNQANMYSARGERLNVARDTLKVFESVAAVFPGVRVGDIAAEDKWFKTALENLESEYPKYFKHSEYDIGGGRMMPCLIVLQKTIPMNVFIEQALHIMRAQVDSFGARVDAASKDEIDWKATMHAVRIIEEAKDLLTNHSISLPVSREMRNMLLSVRRGEVSIDIVRQHMEQRIAEVKELEANSSLPEVNDIREEFEEFMKTEMRLFYGVR